MTTERFLTFLHSDLTPIEDLTRREFMFSALGATLLIACGSDDAEDTGNADETVTIDDHFGPVTIPANPQRVVAADFLSLESILSLGVKPIAAPFSRWNPPDYLSDRLEGIENINTESGLDLEKALSLNPDLTIMSVGLIDGALFREEDYHRFQAVIPTFGYTYHFSYIEQLVANLREVARALGRQERAEEVIAAYENRVAELRQRVIGAGLNERPISIIRLTSDSYWLIFGISGNIVFRALSIPQPEGMDNPDDLFREISLEQLNLLNAAGTVFLFADAGAEAHLASTMQNPVWTGLEPVRDGRVHQVDSGSWNSMGFIGLMSILDDIESLLIAQAEAS